MASSSTYKEKLKEILRMKSAAASAVYRRAVILIDVFNDRDFRADLGNADDFKAADALDQYCDDLPYQFLDLQAMVDAVPESSEWKKRSLREIYEQSRMAAKERDADSRPLKPRRTVTVKEHEEVLTQCKAAESRAKHAADMLEEKRKSYEELSKECAALRQENAELKGRIKELERIVGRELAAA